MKKILTSLMLFTASFMLLFTLTTHEVHAVGETEEYTFEFTTNDGFFVGNATDNYLFSYLEMIYNASANPDFEILIDHIDYNDITVTRNINDSLDVIYYFITITTDTHNYVINVELDDIDTYFDDGLPNNTYTLVITHVPETYHDLFYELIEVEIEFLSETELTPGTYDLLLSLYDQYGTVEGISFYLNDLYINNDGILDNYLYLYFSDYDTGDYSLEFNQDDTYEHNMGTYLVNDVLKLEIEVMKPWTQAYDYGRIRTNESTLYLNQPSDTTAFLSHSPTNNVIDVNNIAVGDEIIMQSPFSKFEVDYGNIGFPRVKLVTQDNIAAVKMIKHSTKNYSFVLYYWFEGEIRSRTVSDIDLSNRNSLNITFSGDLRKAIDYQDVMV